MCDALGILFVATTLEVFLLLQVFFITQYKVKDFLHVYIFSDPRPSLYFRLYT